VGDAADFIRPTIPQPYKADTDPPRPGGARINMKGGF
jgi:hypothetical protein